MIATLLEAKARLEAAGLYVGSGHNGAMLIATGFSDDGDGIRILHDACALFEHEGHWLVIFPGRGMTKREVPGQLPDLVTLIEAVYRRHQSTGGELWEAARDVIDGPSPAATSRQSNGPASAPEASSIPQSRS